MFRKHGWLSRKQWLLFSMLLCCFSLSWPASQTARPAAYHPRRLIVKFKAGSMLLSQVESGQAGPRISRLDGWSAIKKDRAAGPLPGGIERIFVAQVANDVDLDEALAEIASHPEVEYAERDYAGYGDGEVDLGSAAPHPLALYPDDPLFPLQWDLRNTGQAVGGIAGKPGIDINASAAWDITTGDQSTVLAVMDTGIALKAPDFAGRLLPGYDFVNNDNDPSDDYGHGTNVASIAAATGANGIAVAGVNWRCRILPIKILDNKSSGFYSWWASGFAYAADHGANVINISAGGSSPSQALADSVTYAASKGVIIVACMMNDNNETPYYPAAYPNVIAVGAINNRGERAVPFCYSSTSGSNYGSHIGFVAPGERILGLDYQNPSQSSTWCGTSQATPLVSGIISLMYAINPKLTFQQAYDALKAGAQDLVGPPSEDTPGWDKYFGWGKVDAYKSLLAAQGVTFFSHVAIGAGYTTVFAFSNPGNTPATGRLVLTDKSGGPLDASLSGPSVVPNISESAGRVLASSISISIPPGGTQYVTALDPTSGSDTKTGWARLEYASGILSGVATFQLAQPNGPLQTAAGVLSAKTVVSATIPVDDDVSDDRYTGYAIANPGTSGIVIRALLVNEDGSVVATLIPIALGPGQQTAAYFFQDPNARPQFRGSVVLIGQDGAPFSVVALVQNHGLFTAIPVIPGKSPAIPD